MKTFSQNYYNNVIATDVTTIATCFRIELKDGRILGFTTNTRDTVYLSFEIPIGSEFNGSTMEVRWKIDTVMVNKLPKLNQKLLHYRVVR